MQKYLIPFTIFFSFFISAQNVYKTPAGNKYHLASCRMVKNVSSALSVNRALSQGLLPCKICKPPFVAGTKIISKPKKVSGENSQSQCRGFTKSGSRCKRKTRIGNDYCFQHLAK